MRVTPLGRSERASGTLIRIFWEEKMAKGRRGLDKRRRDKTGRIDRKHGNTKVAALRKEYGPGFAKGRRKDLMLKNLLRETGSESLHQYLRKHHR
jgi:hypothetical protein